MLIQLTLPCRRGLQQSTHHRADWLARASEEDQPRHVHPVHAQHDGSDCRARVQHRLRALGHDLREQTLLQLDAQGLLNVHAKVSANFNKNILVKFKNDTCHIPNKY